MWGEVVGTWASEGSTGWVPARPSVTVYCVGFWLPVDLFDHLHGSLDASPCCGSGVADLESGAWGKAACCTWSSCPVQGNASSGLGQAQPKMLLDIAVLLVLGDKSVFHDVM